MAIEVRLLGETDDRSSFQSGDEQLDLFFRRYAGQNQFRHHLGTTYVAVESETIRGFATVTVGHVEIENLPPGLRKKLPDYPLRFSGSSGWRSTATLREWVSAST